MATTAQRQDPAVLVRVEHVVTRVLARAPGRARAYPKLLEAICLDLGWEFVAWELRVEGTMRCAATWRASGVSGADFAAATGRLAFRRGKGLPGRVWATGRPASIRELEADAGFPLLAAARRAGMRSASDEHQVRRAGQHRGPGVASMRQRRDLRRPVRRDAPPGRFVVRCASVVAFHGCPRAARGEY
jgi:hypothetical protein